MLSDVALRIMVRAIKIKMRNGMTLEEALASYPRLTEEGKQQIRDAIGA